MPTNADYLAHLKSYGISANDKKSYNKFKANYERVHGKITSAPTTVKSSSSSSSSNSGGSQNFAQSDPRNSQYTVSKTSGAPTQATYNVGTASTRTNPKNGRVSNLAEFSVPDPYNNGKTLTVEAAWNPSNGTWNVTDMAGNDRHNSYALNMGELANSIRYFGPPVQQNSVEQAIAPSSGGGGGSSSSRSFEDIINTSLNDGSAQYTQQNSIKTDKNQAALQDAYDSAFNRVNERFTERGLDPSTYQSQIERELGIIRDSILPGSNNPAQYFSGDLTNPIVSTITNDNVRDYTTQLNNMFGVGFEDTYFGNDFGNDAIDSRINTASSEAQQYFDNALKRGNTTSAGYENSLERLGDSLGGARSRLTTSRDGIIEGYRGQLNDVSQNARDALGSYTLGTNFDPSSYQTQLDSLYTNLQSRFNDDFSAAIGNDSLIDSNSLVQRSNAIQPASNDAAGASGVLAAVQQRQDRDAKRRGVGTTGIF